MTEPSTVPRTGLLTRDGELAPVPLTGVTIDADVSGFCARVVVTQHAVHRSIEPARASRVARQSPASQAAMHALVALQRADGTWGLDDGLAAVLGRDLADMKRAVAGAHGDPDDASRAWATALAVVWLREHALELEDEWRLLAHKARKWLDDATATPADGGAWLDAARHFLHG